VDGEGVVKILRPLTPRGLKQHFAKNLINAYHRDQQLSNFCDELSAQFRSTRDNMTHPATIMEVLEDLAETELTITDDAMNDDEDITEFVECKRVLVSPQTNEKDDNPHENMNEEESTAFALDSQ
jgi:hypothetical protein